MKNLKSFFGISILSLLVFASCQKEVTLPTETTETRIDAIAENQFDNTSEEETAVLTALLNGEDISAEQAVELKAAACNVAVTSMTYNPAPFPPYFANLNVQYTVNSPTQHIRIKHWKKNASGSYVYQGESGISTSYSTCTSLSVNHGSALFSGNGEYLSWARMYDGTSYLGSYQFLSWTHNP